MNMAQDKIIAWLEIRGVMAEVPQVVQAMQRMSDTLDIAFTANS